MIQENMKFTLEEHFRDLSEKYEQVNEVYSLWTLLKKDISEKLSSVYRAFPYFSRHDASHSRTIITNIELFLGKDRILDLSATDTFMLLICAYTHDYGMALKLEEIFNILKDTNGKFRKYLQSIEESNIYAERLLNYYNQNNSDGDLKQFYQAIILMLQDYNRPIHWKGVEKIRYDYDNMFLGRVKARFINSIIKICEIHGGDVEEIETLSRYSTGMFADEFHPKFIAAMIRLGDLLDLDNNRFSNEFVLSFQNSDNEIPEISKIHYMKHEAITHFFIGPTHIDVEASCEGDNAFRVARELYEWLHWLENDCAYLKAEWDMIAQRDFGAAPRLRTKKIFVDGTEYQHFVYNLKMELPSDKIFNLLAGSNVYDNKYVAFREIIQNAVDATLLQMWKDFFSGLTPEQLNDDYTKLLSNWCVLEKFNSDYKIRVNVVEDTRDNAVYVEVIDSGIGIDDEDLKYMCRIGENNICNPQRHKLIRQMPDWLIPSGVFGIGLQSAFQLTDEIEFFTKKANRTPRHIRFSSYSSNKGQIEVSKCPDAFEEHFNKLSTQGTLVRLKINPNMFNKNNEFDYFDLDFDQNMVDLHVIRVEIVRQFMKYFNMNPIGYFPIIFSDYEMNGTDLEKSNQGRTNCNKTFRDDGLYKTLQCNEEIRIVTNGRSPIKLFYWDKSTNLFLRMEIPRCECIDRTQQIVAIDLVDNCFSIRYKYNCIGDYRQLFDMSCEGVYSDIELESDVVKCCIDIFDKNPEKYLNIDRNVLKYGAMQYSDIIKVKKCALTAFCNKMLNNIGNKENCIYEAIEHFPILSILIVRFADLVSIGKFVKAYKNKLNEVKLKLIETSSEKIVSLSEFLGYSDRLCLYDSQFIQDFEEVAECNQNSLDLDRLNGYFPVHYFTPVSIRIEKFNGERHITYYCKIKNESHIEYIEIDDNVWKYDCIELCKSDPNQLQRKALKPVTKYGALIVDRLPKTFQKGLIFRNALDDNISKYILSPFDRMGGKKLFECKGKMFSQEELTKHVEEIIEYLKTCTHFEKCVRYVKNNTSGSDEEIKRTYFALVEDIANIFNEYRKL